MPESLIVVTGGASGIGAATGALLRAAGKRVRVWDVTTADSPESAQVDVTDAASVETAWADVVREGTVQGLVNAAGIFQVEELEQVSPDGWARTIAVNLTGTFLTSRLAFEHMRAAGGGSIVNIASLAGVRAPLAPCAPYAASKGGVIAFTRAIAREGAPFGVRANCVSPGPIETPMTTGAMTPDQLDAYRSRLPIGRAGKPSEVGAVIAFLLSEEASFVSGTNVEVAGG